MYQESLSHPRPETEMSRYDLSEEQKAALSVELRVGLALANGAEDHVFASGKAFTEWLEEQTGVDDRKTLIEANKFLRREEYMDRPATVEGGIMVPLTARGVRWLQENLPPPQRHD